MDFLASHSPHFFQDNDTCEKLSTIQPKHYSYPNFNEESYSEKKFILLSCLPHYVYSALSVLYFHLVYSRFPLSTLGVLSFSRMSLHAQETPCSTSLAPQLPLRGPVILVFPRVLMSSDSLERLDILLMKPSTSTHKDAAHTRKATPRSVCRSISEQQDSPSWPGCPNLPLPRRVAMNRARCKDRLRVGRLRPTRSCGGEPSRQARACASLRLSSKAVGA